MHWFLYTLLLTLAPALALAQATEPLTEPGLKVRCGVAQGEFPQVQAVQQYSKSVQDDLCYLVIPPEQVLPGKAKKVPMLMLLHGLHGGPGDWLRMPRILSRIREVFSRPQGGQTPYVVIPYGRNGYWTNWNESPKQWRDWVTQEVIPRVEAHYPDISVNPRDRAIAGISMGGFGALSIALEYPGLFGHSVSLSGTDMDIAIQGTNQQKVYKRVFGKELPLPRVHLFNPLHQVQRGLGGGQRFFVVYGDHEAAKFREGGKRLVEALRKGGLSVESRIVKGGTHSFKTTWNPEIMKEWLTWLAEAWNHGDDVPGTDE